MANLTDEQPPHWQLRLAKRHGTLVAQTLERSWRPNPPALDLAPNDWPSIAPILLDSPAAALTWNKLRHTPPETPFYNHFQNAYRFSALRSEMRTRDLQTALAKLRQAQIEPIVHKGWSTARLYPDPSLRAYSDIDLMIHPDHLALALTALNAPPPIDSPIDLVHSEISELDPTPLEALYARSRPVELGPDKVRILSPEDHLRTLCIHALKHGVASPLWLVDVAVALESAPAHFDWNLCLGTHQPQANWIRTALSLAHRLLKADIQHTPVTSFTNDLPEWLVRSVLRRWSRPPVPAPLPRLATVLQRRKGLLEALAWRWPSACQSTIDAHALFTPVPNLHLQLRFLCASLRPRTFLATFPTLWRESRHASSGTRN